jgi:hypothetical protein
MKSRCITRRSRQPDIIALRDLRHATEHGGEPQNQSPQLVNPGAQGTLVGALVSLPISASDPENNPITFSASGLAHRDWRFHPAPASSPAR